MAFDQEADIRSYRITGCGDALDGAADGVRFESLDAVVSVDNHEVAEGAVAARLTGLVSTDAIFMVRSLRVALQYVDARINAAGFDDASLEAAEQALATIDPIDDSAFP